MNFMVLKEIALKRKKKENKSNTEMCGVSQWDCKCYGNFETNFISFYGQHTHPVYKQWVKGLHMSIIQLSLFLSQPSGITTILPYQTRKNLNSKSIGCHSYLLCCIVPPRRLSVRLEKIYCFY